MAPGGRAVLRSGRSRRSTGPCGALAASDRILEANTKSPLVAPCPGLVAGGGGRAVSFGSDAHQPWRVGDKFKLAVDVVEAAGFRPGRDRFDFWRL